MANELGGEKSVTAASPPIFCAAGAVGSLLIVNPDFADFRLQIFAAAWLEFPSDYSTKQSLGKSEFSPKIHLPQAATGRPLQTRALRASRQILHQGLNGASHNSSLPGTGI